MDGFCPALRFPRTLTQVLPDAADRYHLRRIYFERVRHKSTLTYYNLLQQLATDRRDRRLRRILRDIERRVERHFGPGYVLVNDFYSYRAPHERMFASWHQDFEFWLTADKTQPAASCTGFNLWILLDHHRMNYSFDVFDVHRSRRLYDAVYAGRYGVGSVANLTSAAPIHRFPSESYRASRSGILGWLPQAERASFRGRAVPQHTNVPLEVGDALVLKQVEIHRTDGHALQPGQWRLAIGFKVMLQRPVQRECVSGSPFGGDSLRVRRRWPGLLPEFRVGQPIPRVYSRGAVADMAARGGGESAVGVALDDLVAFFSTPIHLISTIAALGIVLLVCVMANAAGRVRKGDMSRVGSGRWPLPRAGCLLASAAGLLGLLLLAAAPDAVVTTNVLIHPVPQLDVRAPPTWASCGAPELQRAAGLGLIVSTHQALLEVHPARGCFRLLSSGHGHYYGVVPLAGAPPWLLIGSQGKLSHRVRNASGLPAGSDGVLLFDPAARRVAGMWRLPTSYLHDAILTDDGAYLAVDSDTGAVSELSVDVARHAAGVNARSAGESETRRGGWLALGAGEGRARLRLQRRIPTAPDWGILSGGASSAHANNVIASTRLLWCMHNNLGATSVLRLIDRGSGALRRDIRLGGPNCHNPLFYRGRVLYLLSRVGGLGLLAPNGSSTVLWAAGAGWFSKGLAVVDGLAYFGLAPKQLRAVERNDAQAELVAFDLARNALVWRVKMPFPGLINALSAPKVAPSCSWKACATTAVEEQLHAPSEADWLL